MSNTRICTIEWCTKEFPNNSSGLIRHIGSTHSKVLQIIKKKGIKIPAIFSTKRTSMKNSCLISILWEQPSWFIWLYITHRKINASKLINYFMYNPPVMVLLYITIKLLLKNWILIIYFKIISSTIMLCLL